MADVIAHYKVLARLGSGALGDVYRARDTKVGRTVALKVVPSALAGDVQQRLELVRHARDLTALSHPNVAALFEVGEAGDLVFLAFEYVLGETLRSVIGDRPLHPRRAVDLAFQLADACSEGHRLGLLHLDLRPDNVLVTQAGRPKILDFGLARWTTGGQVRRDVARGAPESAGAARILPYLSPEQALGEPADHRSDVFSLGTLLYEMLTGRSPFDATAPEDTLVQVVQASVPPPSRANPRVPADVDLIVMRAIRKSLDARWQGAAEMAGQLRIALAALDAQKARAVAPAPRPAVRARRHGTVGWLLVIALALAAAAWFGRNEAVRLWREVVSTAPAAPR